MLGASLAEKQQNQFYSLGWTLEESMLIITPPKWSIIEFSTVIAELDQLAYILCHIEFDH